MENIKIWSEKIFGYQLLDSGEKEKLEEIGGLKIKRSEPRAWWRKTVDSKEYQAVGEKQKKELEEIIDIGIGEIKAKIKFKAGSKHIGIFPEQAAEWKWIKEKVASSQQLAAREIKVLNLFGYTGIASLVAAKAGAKVTHVDASKQSVDWARENQKLSGLEDAPIRWIVDDVVKFLKKEKNRLAQRSLGEVGGERYDAIIMDPPSYGKGPKGEVWKIEEQLPDLMKYCREILSDKPLFIIMNMYSTELSSISIANLLSDATKGLGGQIEFGELVIKQENSERLLPMSIFAIWENKNK